jgi:hypothetical protein
MHNVFNQTLDAQLIEIHQDNYTRVGMLDGKTHVLSRIDRWYTNMDPVMAQDLRCQAGIFHPLCFNELSDHVPLYLKIYIASGAPVSPSVPRWIAERPDYARLLDETINDLPINLCSFKQLQNIKDCMYSVAARLKRPTEMLFGSRKETIHWALVALRALHRDDLRRVYDITDKVAAFHRPPDPLDFHATLTNYIGGLMNDDLGLEAREVEKAEIPEEEKRRRLAHVRRRAGSWAQVQRRLVLHAVLREDGTPHPDQHSSVRALADH